MSQGQYTNLECLAVEIPPYAPNSRLHCRHKKTLDTRQGDLNRKNPAFR